ncbi:hypothetical protein HUN01_17315 [Nostoc edaphicum CCNP1411]|uniref:Uncharacterized protein n=1 Tax=Nostoc edaphicum CCNP1411 TaxID=1472755 RepID=A0A7D7LBG9_9NOSO|nr:hypothetical protein [Nostoc edaphicum]QMS89253.1 hypothetical protein HUN01_17315 [Nostoc edaphicum CCNP1411]
MGTTTLTKAVLMIIRVIWLRANGIDTKAHEWVMGNERDEGDGGDEGDDRDGEIINAPCPIFLDIAPINSSVAV